MDIKAKYSVVVKDNKVTEETKVFRKKQQAQMYAASLQEKGNGSYSVIDLEAILD